MDGQLLRFRVKNHRSLRDEQELSFIASGQDGTGLIHPTGLEEAVVPVAVMYGANASGKSNVIDALVFMQHAVSASQRRWEPTGGVPRQPFALGREKTEVSAFAVEIMLAGVRYEYGFSVDDEIVQEEWLSAWPHGRKQEWFSREQQSFDFGRSLHGENRSIEALTRPNSLFLSAAAQNNHEQLAPVFQWFADRMRVAMRRVGQIPSHSNWWKQFVPDKAGLHSKRLRERVSSLLAAADLGIDDFRVTEERFEVPVGIASTGFDDSKSFTRQRLSFSHGGARAQTWLDLGVESTGTQLLVSLIPVLLPLLDQGGILAIDELNSLHPMMSLALVKMFQDPARNPNGSQLLFNTHESSLLGTLLADPPPLRRDQVWLTEKDKEGATHLYPLTDYTPRSTENLERGYLQGRYGAVPFFGSFDGGAKVGE